MSFEEEWSTIKQNGAEAPSAHMQLNQTPDGSYRPGRGGSAVGDLQVDQKDLAAIGDEAYKLYRRLEKDGDHARVSTETAKASLSGDFELGPALGHVADSWQKQLKTVLDACAHISNHLDYTKKAHQGDEVFLSVQFSKISELEKGFDEKTEAQPAHEPRRRGGEGGGD